MPDRTPCRRRRTTLKIGVGVAAAAFALAVPLGVARLAMLGLFTAMWVSMIVIYRMQRRESRSALLMPYIFFVGVGLLVLIVTLVIQ